MNTQRTIFLFLLVSIFIFVSGCSVRSSSDSRKPLNPESSPVEETNTFVLNSYSTIPLYFIAHKGQLNSEVLFYETGTSGRTAHFSKQVSKQGVSEMYSQKDKAVAVK